MKERTLHGQHLPALWSVCHLPKGLGRSTPRARPGVSSTLSEDVRRGGAVLRGEAVRLVGALQHRGEVEEFSCVFLV